MNDDTLDEPTAGSSRRRFLTTTAGVGAGVWAAPTVLATARASAETSPVPPRCAPAVLLFDDFDQESYGTPQGSLQNWNISDGTIDIIGSGPRGSGFDFVPGNGYYVDLDGSSSPGDAGKLTSKQSFTFRAGCDYELRYRLAGSRRGDTNTVTVRVDGGMPEQAHTLGSGDGPTTYTLAFTPPADIVSTISFTHAGGDNVGLLLFTVELVCV